MRWCPSSPRSRFCALIFAAALAAVFAALPAGAFAADKGIQTDMTWGAGNQTQTANAMQDIGAHWTRITLSWHDVESRQGSYSLSSVDNAVSLSRARGIKVLINVVETPSWETGSSDKRMPPKNMADFAKFLADMATHYKGQADAWEIWNEENQQRFWPTGVNAAQYAQMLVAAYPAIHANDPGVPVVFGGLARNDYGYLQAAYQAVPNLGSFYDVMATHPYPGVNDLNGPPDLTIRNPDGSISENSFNGYRQVRQTMLSHGDDKPIWFTEIGWSTWSGGVSPQTQAAYTTKAFQCVEQDPYVQILFTYNLRNNYWANDADDWDDQLGLMYTNWTHKPAYDAYKAYVPGAGAGACTYHEGNGAGTPAGTTPPPPSTTTGTPGNTPSTSTSTSTGPGSQPGVATTHTKISIRKIKSPRNLRLRAAAARVQFTVVGRVFGATSGRVTIQVQRRVKGKWRLVSSANTTVGATGSFLSKVSTRFASKLRVRALFRGSPQHRPSRSKYTVLRAASLIPARRG